MDNLNWYNKFIMRNAGTTFFAGQKPSFLSGMGSVLNIHGSYVHYKQNRQFGSFCYDNKAIENDWNIVGKDIANSVTEFEKEYKP